MNQSESQNTIYQGNIIWGGRNPRRGTMSPKHGTKVEREMAKSKVEMAVPGWRS